jgi:hypothetical protein
LGRWKSGWIKNKWSLLVDVLSNLADGPYVQDFPPLAQPVLAAYHYEALFFL